MSTLKRQLQQVRQITSRPIILAFTAQWERDEILDYCLEIGQRFFQVFWWNAPRQIARIRHAGGVVLVQVGSASQAQEAVETGADVLVVQGTEAGGPVRSPYPLRQLITEVAMVTEEKVPIIAGGGLADARDVRDVLSWGASVAMLGTRFLLSEEAYASDRHKAMLRRAKTNQLLLDPRLVGDWPCAPRRRLMTLRNEDTPELFAGRGLSKIQEVLPVVEILRQLSPSKSLCQR
jgi:nitronate monooxygenase